jgi:hypothetical protein
MSDESPTRPDTLPIAPGAAAARGIPESLVSLIHQVRQGMRDYSDLNRLIAGREHSDRDIALVVAELIDEWNGTPPLIDNISLNRLPTGVAPIIVDGAIAKLLRSAALLQMRNHLQYSDGDTGTSSSDKAPQYLAVANAMEATYVEKRRRLKIALNLRGGMNQSGVPSEYTYVHGFFTDEVS